MSEGLKEKLIAAKQRWAKEGRLLTGRTDPDRTRRLPPGQRQTQEWPVLDLGITPRVHTDDWRFSVGGAVERPLQWRWSDFMAQPQLQVRCDMHCVTAWSRFANRWEGVSARYLLSIVRPLPEAQYVVFHSFDGYTTNLPLSAFDDEDVLLVHSWEGQPLTREHGGPVRALVPKLYLWKSAKWLSRIEFTADNRPGFWEVRGYHDFGDPWLEQRYSE